MKYIYLTHDEFITLHDFTLTNKVKYSATLFLLEIINNVRRHRNPPNPQLYPLDKYIKKAIVNKNQEFCFCIGFENLDEEKLNHVDQIFANFEMYTLNNESFYLQKRHDVLWFSGTKNHYITYNNIKCRIEFVGNGFIELSNMTIDNIRFKKKEIKVFDEETQITEFNGLKNDMFYRFKEALLQEFNLYLSKIARRTI